MENRNRDQWGSSKPSYSNDSDVSFGKKHTDIETDIEEIDRETEGDVERYEDTTPMSNRGDLSEH